MHCKFVGFSDFFMRYILMGQCLILNAPKDAVSKASILHSCSAVWWSDLQSSSTVQSLSARHSANNSSHVWRWFSIRSGIPGGSLELITYSQQIIAGRHGYRNIGAGVTDLTVDSQCSLSGYCVWQLIYPALFLQIFLPYFNHLCSTRFGLSKSQKILKSHHLFKSYVAFAK